MRNIIVGFWMWLFGDWKAYQKERLKICNECAPDRSTCPECGCFKDLKVKVKSEGCPIGRWNERAEYLHEEYFKQMNIQ